MDDPGIQPQPSLDDIGRIWSQGDRIRFDGFMHACLYDPRHGFYASGGRAGARAGDFITSPEVGPLFGAVVAGVVDHWWDAAGQPGEFTVAECGAGPGTLGAAVRMANPRCAAHLRWVMVERTAAQRQHHVERLGAIPVGADPVGAPTTRADLDMIAEPGMPTPDGRVRLLSTDTLPTTADAVVANELLDNIPVRIVERTTDGWAELWVGIGPDGEAVGELQPLDVPDGDVAAVVDGPGASVAIGQRIPVQSGAMAWLSQALEVVGERGQVLVFDYADTTASMGERGMEAWLRTYAAHGRGGPPFDAPGSQDVTCDIAVDQLALVRRPDTDLSQADYLGAMGIGELVAEGRRIWSERAGIGDLAAVAARSRVTEADALTDPDGLGAHRALVWGPAATSES